jgi:L-aspartate oxidase
LSYDYLVVGSGIAGLYTALLASRAGRVLLLTKASIEDCNTLHAQGGIAAAIGHDDSPKLHLSDTLAAGAGLCDQRVARIVAEEGPDRIRELIALGVPFDTVDGEIALAKEGAHSVPRVLHAGGDATGANIEVTLSRRVSAAGIDVSERQLVTGIEVGGEGVLGLRVLDTRDGQERDIAGRTVVLASGGSGQLFKLTTNPQVATGDGVALAYLAGAEVVDLEFFQFHPTALQVPNAPPFLISEAVRGEGAILRAADGRRFMLEYDPRGELASRDVVARAILSEMRRSQTQHVYLDVTHLSARQVVTRFPSIYRTCLECGLDITVQLIPVAPAAHYMMGGIRTGIWGETTIPGLYACGEVACTGLHGANRLASNSLLEALVFAKRIAERMRGGDRQPLSLSASPFPCPAEGGSPLEGGSGPWFSPSPADLQSLMWESVGILRHGSNLQCGLTTMANWAKTLPAPHLQAEHELANMLLVGRLMSAAALQREESRGAHYRLDFPADCEAWRRHIVFRR